MFPLLVQIELTCELILCSQENKKAKTENKWKREIRVKSRLRVGRVAERWRLGSKTLVFKARRSGEGNGEKKRMSLLLAETEITEGNL